MARSIVSHFWLHETEGKQLISEQFMEFEAGK